MKLRTRLLLLLIGCLALLPFLPAADAPADKPTTIPKAAGPIKIDGVLDEPAWKDAPVVEAQYVWSKVGEKSAEPRMRVRYTWDDNYLYIGYETFDKNLTARGTGAKDGPPGNQRESCVIGGTDKIDVVEFFVTFGDPRFFWEIHQNALNQFSDIWIVVVDDQWPIAKSSLSRYGIQFHTHVFIDDDANAGHTLVRAVKLKPRADGKPSTVNDPSDVDTGYVGEIRLPWLGLGAPLKAETSMQIKTADKKTKNVHGPWKMAGQEMRLLAVVQDGDVQEHAGYFHSSPTKPGGWFHKDSHLWPKYVLEAKK